MESAGTPPSHDQSDFILHAHPPDKRSTIHFFSIYQAFLLDFPRITRALPNPDITRNLDAGTVATLS
jgi:hypothetical protein